MTINNISEYINVLSKIDNKQLFFRGHSDETYKLKPNLYRKENFYINEDNIYKETIVNSPQEFYKCKKAIEVLVKMQHYGIPTRLLDITRNPLVALYFACCENDNVNGEVILLNIPIKSVRFYDSDKVTILANIAKQKVDFGFDFNDDIDYINNDDVAEINNTYFGYLLHSIKEDKPHFYDIINPKDIEGVFAVQVKLDNPRIIKQNGAFLIFGIQKSDEGMSGKTNCAEINAEWILRPNSESVIVPKEAKKNILTELDLLGINNSTLFPELEDYAKYIKDKYNYNK
ncbi:FRG domain-containing protein [Sphingobacterium sp. SG20118]|uniref:FRG domain-containing protein n=1 Tax=Sphingobacterium sp. SG20118 TaxID=3367156 RepID=UPI0037DFC9B7